MSYSTTGKNAMLNALAALAVYGSLHATDPGNTGAGEIAGGSPAYARKSLTWSAASGGSASISNVPVFDVEAGDTVAYVGLWSAVTSGSFYGSADVTDEVYGAQGTYTLLTFTASIT